MKLDRINRKILSDLQNDGRISNVELATNAGISPPPSLRRLRLLEDEGYIRGYHADLEPSMLGYEAEFYVLVGLESQALDRLKAFETAVSLWEEVRECHMIRGGGDFLLRIIARDTSHENELTQRLTSITDVLKVTSFPIIQTSKRLAGVPISLDDD